MPYEKRTMTTGLMWPGRSSNPKAPDYSGWVRFSEEDIRYLLGEMKENGEASMRIAMWREDEDRQAGRQNPAEFSVKLQQDRDRDDGNTRRRVRRADPPPRRGARDNGHEDDGRDYARRGEGRPRRGDYREREESDYRREDHQLRGRADPDLDDDIPW